ncbi:class I SAM-dependent methyltransferase [Kibdelosporangium phytohabitans]|uniref:Methyltransferase n=1 Tax=Kibdelosporangium phytohabitans TaxID=860235 RepID=A0A0N9I5D2_9PSEU|nr:class I SAM-dependent methyltransferase [Kibdelosporangium phytohabitans]ALG11298.1 methyltransferase [Kibdelosporangium phytohabitans]MBE1462593.1 SAM-dependent methyltransferase [Kibdelosporangium phytohabitans]
MRWYENDGLWSGFAETMFPPRRAQEAADLVATSPLLRFQPGAQVLDLCCGPGLWLAPLARRGYQVTGVDLSPVMLAEAKAACPDAELICEDMLEFSRPGQFDVALNVFTSFGYLAEAEDNLQVLRNAYTSLKPGGQLIVDVMGKEVLAGWIGRPQAVDVDGGCVVMRDTILDDWTRLRTDWTLVRGDTARHAVIECFVYSAAELKDLFRQAGFQDVECFGDFDASSYDNHSKRLIVRGYRRD